jgi:hypothetical protein
MRRPWSDRRRHAPARWMGRLDRAAQRMNPYLLVLAIGLFWLDFACLIALEISAPNPPNFDPPAASGTPR